MVLARQGPQNELLTPKFSTHAPEHVSAAPGRDSCVPELVFAPSSLPK